MNDLQFSHDGKWIAYVTYPDRTLWRSRPDGRERLQLTTPPMQAFVPAWSPDDQRILFQAFAKPNQPWKIYLMSPAGSTPELLIPDRDSQEVGGTWLSTQRVSSIPITVFLPPVHWRSVFWT